MLPPLPLGDGARSTHDNVLLLSRPSPPTRTCMLISRTREKRMPESLWPLRRQSTPTCFSTAPAHLATVLDHYKTQRQLRDEDGNAKGVPYAYFSPQFAREAEGELPGVLDAFQTLYQDLPNDPKAKERHYSNAVLLFLNKRYLREEFPRITEILNISLLLPLANASPERLFSSLKLLKTRLRALLEDDSLQELLTMYMVGDYTDVDGLDKEMMRACIDGFVESSARDRNSNTSKYSSFREYEQACDWIMGWRKSFL